jgi:signal transduction histidine kinase
MIMTNFPEALRHRVPMEVIREQAAQFLSCAGLAPVLDAIPSLLLIINENRQVVFANRHAVRTLEVASVEELLGKRPGELFHCQHAEEAALGCGTNEACIACGAARAISMSELDQGATQDCHIHQRDVGRSVDLRIDTTPIHAGKNQFSIVVLSDTSHENRRRALERVFFHDLLNTLGALTGYVQLLDGAPTHEADELTDSILRLSDVLAEEIRAQRDLAAAESHDLAVRFDTVNSREILEQVFVAYRHHPASRGRTIVLGQAVVSENFRSDRRLLQRILTNMVKNALEAAQGGDEVTLDCHKDDSLLTFAVHNPQVMPREVQLQIFHRAFSTKGPGRGLGTYSMKLLGENYLNGEVSFSSTPESGTTFRARFPLPDQARQMRPPSTVLPQNSLP